MIARAWYIGKTGSHQGLVIDESTGANIAMTYDKADAPLVAAAPELLDAARAYLRAVVNIYGQPPHLDNVAHAVKAAIYKAEGRDV